MLRHTFAQTVSGQVTEQDLAKLMGHTDTKTTRFYYDVRDTRAVEVAGTIKFPGSEAVA